MTQTSSRHIRFKGRSFPVLALEPEQPIAGWIEQLDALLAQSPAFFARKSIVIDVAKLELERPAVVELFGNLTQRGIRVMGLSGVDPAWAADDLPPIMSGGRVADETASEPAETPASDTNAGALTPSEEAAFEDIAKALGDDESRTDAVKSDGPPKSASGAPLILVEPVRSGSDRVPSRRRCDRRRLGRLGR